jgi:2-polyprenyl-3-methyl-5-hydroxy-6-metoxy-1,4-benzoquinol methylase
MQFKKVLHATDEITKFYDAASQHYAADYSAENSTVGHFFRTRQSIVLSILSERSGGALLDVGCGPGMYAEPTVALGYRYHGVDASQGMIQECLKHRSPSNDKQFHIGRMEDLPFVEKSFDVVLCLGALEYVEEANLGDAIANFYRVLKPKGVLVLSLLNNNSPYWLWTVYVFPYLQYLYRNIRAVATGAETVPVQHGIPTRLFTVRDATDLLHSKRFEVERVRYFGYDLYPPPFDRWVFRVLRRFTPRLERLSAIPGVSGLSKAFIVCAIRKDGL